MSQMIGRKLKMEIHLYQVTPVLQILRAHFIHKNKQIIIGFKKQFSLELTGGKTRV